MPEQETSKWEKNLQLPTMVRMIYTIYENKMRYR